MIDIFAELDKRFDILEQTANLGTCILTKDDFEEGYQYKTFYSVFDDIFDMWPLNNNFVYLDDMLKELKLLETTNYDTIRFYLQDEQSCYAFLQFFKNAFSFALDHFIKNQRYTQRIRGLLNKLDTIADKANLQFIYYRDKQYFKLAEIKSLTKSIAEKQKPEIAVKMYEYHLLDNKNNIAKKREILLALAHETEVITKTYTKTSGDIYDLYDNLDFALNNFNIRHNNVDGKKKQDAFVQLNDTEVLELYDYTYDLIVAVLNQNATTESLNKISNIRTKFKPNKQKT